MSAVLTGRRPAARRTREVDCRSRPAPEAGPTLDDLVSRTWEVLRADVSASCLLCGGELEPHHAAGAGLVSGRCRSCGTTIE